MSFNEWWDQLTKAERKVLGEQTAKYVWEECQKHTLMTIEDACKAQVAYDQGVKDGYSRGRKHYEVLVGAWRLMPSLRRRRQLPRGRRRVENCCLGDRA